jgi:hypothetical protein
MLKRMILAAVATAFVAAAAVPIQTTPAAAEGMTCKAAAKAKFADDRKARHAFKKECKTAFKASQKA